MTKAFVFGKFLPFHKGHEAMIHFALQHCDLLTVLVCASDREQIPGALRQQWIEQTFEGNDHVQVQLFEYNEAELPNSSESSVSVSKIWAEVFAQLVPECRLLITSEQYGEYLSEFMGIPHLAFDPAKSAFPVSASSIRRNLFEYWQYLPAAVKSYYAIKVVVLGTESTGKTTLTNLLAAHYNCTTVSEAGRDIIHDSRDFVWDDLLVVANEHAARINIAVSGTHPLCIIDTDIHVTMSYSAFLFGQPLIVDEAIEAANKANLYLYLNNDVVFVQDGTRLNEADRNALDQSHRTVCEAHGLGIIEISGDWQTRFTAAVKQIDTGIRRICRLHELGCFIQR